MAFAAHDRPAAGADDWGFFDNDSDSDSGDGPNTSSSSSDHDRSGDDARSANARSANSATSSTAGLAELNSWLYDSCELGVAAWMKAGSVDATGRRRCYFTPGDDGRLGAPAAGASRARARSPVPASSSSDEADDARRPRPLRAGTAGASAGTRRPRPRAAGRPLPQQLWCVTPFERRRVDRPRGHRNCNLLQDDQGRGPVAGCHVDIPRAGRRCRRRGRVAAPPRGATWIFRGASPAYANAAKIVEIGLRPSAVDAGRRLAHARDGADAAALSARVFPRVPRRAESERRRHRRRVARVYTGGAPRGDGLAPRGVPADGVGGRPLPAVVAEPLRLRGARAAAVPRLGAARARGLDRRRGRAALAALRRRLPVRGGVSKSPVSRRRRGRW